jgi:hypothetical protein
LRMRGSETGVSDRQPEECVFDGLRRVLAVESGDGRALAENLEDNPICTVSYDPSVPCLMVRWRSYATSAQLRYIHECLVRLIKKHRVSKILGDDSDLVSIASIDQHWIAREWMPRAIATGLRTVASIKPRAYFGQTSIKNILSFVPAGLAIRSFEGLREARDWLQSVYQPGTYRIIYRRFKGGEPINTFAFDCQDPGIGHFRQFARVALRGFWKVERGALEPVISRQPLPELIMIETEAGETVFRWTLEDEMRQLENSQQAS